MQAKSIRDKSETDQYDEEVCWQAVLARDTYYDGRFVYAVRSTGIYCQPSCPSRKPGRAQVIFFACAEAAEEAGFRPCRRCQGEMSAQAEHMQTELAQSVCRYIETHLDDTLTLEVLAGQMHISPYHLQRTFKRVMGISPRQYVDACRVQVFKSHLRNGEHVTGALYETGYSSSSRLYERANDWIGMTPATYRKRGKGMQIGYTIVACHLGRLLIAATQRGVCAVSLGDDDTALETALHAEYPAAIIQRSDQDFALWVEAILAYLDGNQPHLDLPLDLQATAFQWRVWQALRAIPYGKTRSYSDIARDLGQPTAIRAVARACATNPVSLVVPCHRAVGVDGSLRGYRWGLERKRALLEQERATEGKGERRKSPLQDGITE